MGVFYPLGHTFCDVGISVCRSGAVEFVGGVGRREVVFSGPDIASVKIGENETIPVWVWNIRQTRSSADNFSHLVE